MKPTTNESEARKSTGPNGPVDPLSSLDLDGVKAALRRGGYSDRGLLSAVYKGRSDGGKSYVYQVTYTDPTAADGQGRCEAFICRDEYRGGMVVGDF